MAHRELHQDEAEGRRVTLYWDDETDELLLEVADGFDVFEVTGIEPENAMYAVKLALTAPGPAYR